MCGRTRLRRAGPGLSWVFALALGCDAAPGGALSSGADRSVRHPENVAEVAAGPIERVDGPDAPRFVVVDGALAFVTPPDFEAPADADGDGVYVVDVDAGARIRVEVVDVDEPPVFRGARRVAVEEGRAGLPVGGFRDPEGASVTVRVAGGADAAAFVVEEGALAWAAPPDFEAPGDIDGDNVYRFRLEGADPTGRVGQAELSVTVRDVAEGPEPALEVLFPMGALEEGRDAAVLVETTGFSSAADVALVSATEETPLTYAGEGRWRGRYALGAPEVTVRATEGGRAAQASFRVVRAPRRVRRPVAVGSAPGDGRGWALDADGPRALVVRAGRVLEEIALPRIRPRDIEPLPSGEAALVLGAERLLRVLASGEVRTVARGLDDARAVASGARGRAALVLEPGRLLRVDLASGRAEVLSGSADAGPALEGAVDLTAVEARGFAQTVSGAGESRVLEVDLATGTRRALAALGPARAAFGLASGRSGVLHALADARWMRLRLRDGALLEGAEVLSERGAPLVSGRLGRGPVEGQNPALARPLPPLLTRLEGDPPRASRMFGVVGDGPALGAIDALAAGPGGRRLGVLRRRGLGLLRGLRRTVLDLAELSAPSALTLTGGEGFAGVVADRDADRVFAVRPSGRLEPLPDPAETAGRGFEAPVALGADDQGAVWVLDAAPPALFRFAEGTWTLPRAELGLARAGSFALAEQTVFVLDGPRVRQVSLRDGRSTIRAELDRPLELAASPDGLFALLAGGRVVRVGRAGEAEVVASAARGVGGSLAGAVGLAADGRGRLFVAFPEGKVMLVELGSGDRVVVAR